MRRLLAFPTTLAATLCLAFVFGLGLEASAATKSKKSASSTSADAPAKKTAARSSAPARVKKPVESEAEEPTRTLPNGVPIVRAASVLIVDARTGEVLYEKNADQRRPPASTQKLLTALIVAEAGGLDRPVEVEASDTWAEPVKLNIQPGEVYRRYELLQVLLVHSTNDVARCLARDNAGSVEAFADKMNRKAAELGMNESHFVNPNGLPAPGQYSTARDMARLALVAYQNRTIRSIVSTKEMWFRYADGRVRHFDNTNKVLRSNPLCNGMKTGYTEAAGHCLISSASNGSRDVIVVALGDNQAIWKDSQALLMWALYAKAGEQQVGSSF